MRKIFSVIVAIVVLLTSISKTAVGQEEVQGIKQVLDITTDDLGNAVITVTMKLNAQQWDNYKKSIGSNTSIFKWNMQKALPKYYLSDFSVDEDQMERTFKIKFKALGLVSINKNGKWEARLETKNPDITRLSDNEFVMTANLNDQGQLIEQTQKLHLPSGAQNAKVEKDSFGKAVLTYSTGSGLLQKLPLFLGLLIILSGAVLLFKNMQQKKSIPAARIS